MGAPPRQPSLTIEQCRVLVLLASIPYAITEDRLVFAHGFDRVMIAGLVHEGLATAHREIVTGSRRGTIEVVRIRITEAARMALEG
jgi:hypothetical protein